MLASEAAAAGTTRDSYRSDLRDLMAFAVDLGASPLDLTAEQISGYLQHLSDRGLKRTTQARRRAALRRYYRFLAEEGARADDPTRLMEGRRIARDIPDVLRPHQVDQLFEAVEAIDSWIGLRMATLLTVLYATGLRVSELVAMPVGAFMPSEAVLRIRGKGDKERLIPLTTRAHDALAGWKPLRFGAMTKSAVMAPWMFPSDRARDGHLTRQRLGQQLKWLADEAGLPRESVHPHALRHAFATHLLDNGADLVAVQRLLGHASLSTTEIYTHVLQGRLTDTVTRLHPLAAREDGGR